MKKLFYPLVAAILGFATAAQAQLTVSTNVVAGTYVLLSTRATIKSVQIMATNNTVVEFYDQNTVAAPYYGTNVVVGAYQSRTSYTTNYAYSYIDFGGYTNWYTNSGIATVLVTNAAATNRLPISGAFSATANDMGDYQNLNILCARGVVIRTPLAAVVTVTYWP